VILAAILSDLIEVLSGVIDLALQSLALIQQQAPLTLRAKRVAFENANRQGGRAPVS